MAVRSAKELVVYVKAYDLDEDISHQQAVPA
jgi:hypothetical protein